MTMYEDLTRQFCEYHKNSVNIALHLVTTPLAIMSIFLVLRNLLFPATDAVESYVSI